MVNTTNTGPNPGDTNTTAQTQTPIAEVYGTPGTGKVPQWNATTGRFEWTDLSAAYIPVPSTAQPGSPADGQMWLSNRLADLGIEDGPQSRSKVIIPTLANEGTSVQEMSVWSGAGSKYWMLYTGSANGLMQASCPITSDPLDSTSWTKSNTLVLGAGQGGETNGVAHSGVYQEGSTLYCFYVDVTSQDIKYATASATADPPVWTAQGSVGVAKPAPFLAWGNLFVVKDGSNYRLFAEYQLSNGTDWQTNVYSSTTLTSGYTLTVGPLTSLRPFTGTAVSGAWVGWDADTAKWVAYYHANQGAGWGPTNLYKATTTDLTTDAWTIQNGGFPIVRRSAPQEVDQVADAWVLTAANGSTKYLFWEGCDNRHNPTFSSTIFGAVLLPAKRRYDGAVWVRERDLGPKRPIYSATPWLYTWSAAEAGLAGEGVQIIQGTWITQADSTNVGDGKFFNNTNALNDAIQFPVLLSPGTWQFSLVYSKDTNRATFNVDHDTGGEGLYYANFKQVDAYAASTATATATATLTVPGDETIMRNIRIKAIGRNASNTTGYWMQFYSWTFRRTA